jgi:tubby-related protein 1
MNLTDNNKYTNEILTPILKRSESLKLDTSELKSIECENIRTSTSDEAIINLLLEGRYVGDEIGNFHNSPLPVGNSLECNIARYKSGKKLYYNLLISNNIILTAEKRSNCSYTIFKNSNVDDVLAVLNSNFLGIEFELTSNGKAFIGIKYELNVLGIKGPRRMKIYLPSNHEGIKINKNENVIKMFEANKEVNVYKNKMPIWSESNIIYKEHQSHILDFKGRVRRMSVKNFQIMDDDNLILQFGRSDEDSYIMDFRYPFTPIQAFAISLSSIDKKYGCQ